MPPPTSMTTFINIDARRTTMTTSPFDYDVRFADGVTATLVTYACHAELPPTIRHIRCRLMETEKRGDA